MRLMVFPLILLVSVSCQPGAASLADEDVAALRELGQAYVRGFSSGDAGGVAAVYAEGAVEMPPGVAVREGADAIRSAYQEYFDAGAETVSFTMTAAEIDGIGRLAFDRGTWGWTGREGAGGELVSQTGNYLAIARRQADGSWRYTSMIWNSDSSLQQGSPQE